MRIESNSNTFSGAASAYGREYSDSRCVRNLFNTVILPEIPTVSDDPGLGARIIDHLTGIPEFLRSFRQEACQGKLTEDSAKALIKAVGKAGLVTAAGGAAIAGGVFGGLAAASTVGVVGGIVLGGAVVLGFGPKIVEKAVDGGFALLNRLTDRTSEWRNGFNA